MLKHLVAELKLFVDEGSEDIEPQRSRAANCEVHHKAISGPSRDGIEEVRQLTLGEAHPVFDQAQLGTGAGPVNDEYVGHLFL